MMDDPNRLHLGFVNDALAAGWRVTKFDHLIEVEEGGYQILVDLERT